MAELADAPDLGSGTSVCRFDPCYPHHVGMDCAPFKKPGRLAGLFSYRSVIPSRPKSRRLRGGWPRNAPAGAVLLPTKFCCANFRGGPGRPAGGKYASCASLAAAYFKPPTRSLRCGSFSPQNFAAQTFVGAPAALRAAYRLCSIQKARPVGRAFLIPLRHSISAQEPPLTRRLASKRACGRSPSPHKILLRKLPRGPRPPCGRQIRKLCIACGGLF